MCRKRCLESDLHGFAKALERKGPYRYRCHMGLTETVTPILYDDILVGFMMVGQNLLCEDLDIVRERMEQVEDASLRNALLRELDGMKFTNEAELAAMNNVVEMCVSYLRLKQLIRFKETPTPVLLKNYIATHLAEELDIRVLCKEFNMSKSSLYLLSREALGKGVTAYIREQRMERAKVLLTETKQPISRVAEQVGYADTNYFTKVFRKYAGKTPSDWRREANAEGMVKK